MAVLEEMEEEEPLLEPGTGVEVSGLNARPDLNGELGRVIGYLPARERYQVRMRWRVSGVTGSGDAEEILLRRRNLARSEEAEAEIVAEGTVAAAAAVAAASGAQAGVAAAAPVGAGDDGSDSDDEPPPLDSAAQLDALNARRAVADKVAATKLGHSSGGSKPSGGAAVAAAAKQPGGGKIKKGFFDAPQPKASAPEMTFLKGKKGKAKAGAYTRSLFNST